jgi:competence protein ComEC
MAEVRGPRASAEVIAGVWEGAQGVRRAAAALRGQGLLSVLRLWLSQEEDGRRLFLWLPVAYGVGVLIYFSADSEPSLWAAIAAAAVSAFAAALFRRRGHIGAFRIAMAVACLTGGFTTCCIKTWHVAAPVLERTLATRITAYVEIVDPRETGARLLLRPAPIEALGAAKTPQRIRVTMRGKPAFEAGATITTTVRILPPPRPSEPGGYDFSRDAYFQQIGAVGSMSSQPALAPDMDVPLLPRVNAAIDRARNRLTERIIQTVGGAHGPVAAALVTGKRGQISEETNEALRGAGIYHVVSISGLHLVLAAGLFLWSLRALLALLPGLALTQPIKTWAAVFAMAGAISYDLFSGSEVATDRSLVMVLILLGAVLAGRPAFSMRNLAIAAFVVMAIEPQSLLGPSFQMSFAAVAAMIAAFEKRAGATDGWGRPIDPREPAADRRATWLGRTRLIVGSMIVTTLVASFATDPYASYHFHRITPFGLIGNMLVLPLVEFIVMPAAVLGVLANPFGLDGPVWWLMGQGTAFMLEVARWVSSLDGATLHLPAFGPSALLTMTVGLLWLVLWQTPLRWLGIPVLGGGIALAASTVQPDIVIDRQGRSLAYRMEDGRLAVLNAKANPFGVAQWLTADADTRKPTDPGLPGNGLCDARGCTGLLRDGRTLALVLEREVLVHDCARADIIVTPIFAEGLCKGPERLIDGAHLATHGSTRMWIKGDGGITQQFARQATYDRPWSPAPRRSQPTVAGTGWTPALDPAVAGANEVLNPY